jgi:hypothetical protein
MRSEIFNRPGVHYYNTVAMPLAVRVLLVLVAVVAWWWLEHALRLDRVVTRLYWRKLPLRRMTLLLLAQFVSLSSIGFLLDIMGGGHGSRAWVFLTAASIGAASVARFLLQARYPLILRVIILTAIVAGMTFSRGGGSAGAAPPSASAIFYDSIAIAVTAFVGSRLYLAYVSSEGMRQLRVEAELALAHQLQGVLVPTVQVREPRLEVYGASMPSDKVGGDLVDYVSTGRRALAYLVDVSGHGIPAAALMGAVKTAIRMAFPARLPGILDALNQVLPSVKEPQMYATLAALAFDEMSSLVEYALAGHMPILHFQSAGGAVTRLFCEEFPLGLLPGTHYQSGWAPCAPGDLFVLFSDGIVETVNASDEQFGLERLEAVVRANADLPLPDVLKGVLAAAAAHGHADDDQSLLLVRVLA